MYYSSKITNPNKLGIEGLNLINIIYRKRTASMMLSGEKVNAFLQRSGTRQGSLLSPIQFNFLLDVLSVAIRQEK